MKKLKNISFQIQGSSFQQTYKRPMLAINPIVS